MKRTIAALTATLVLSAASVVQAQSEIPEFDLTEQETCGRYSLNMGQHLLWGAPLRYRLKESAGDCTVSLSNNQLRWVFNGNVDTQDLARIEPQRFTGKQLRQNSQSDKASQNTLELIESALDPDDYLTEGYMFPVNKTRSIVVMNSKRGYTLAIIQYQQNMFWVASFADRINKVQANEPITFE